MEEVTNILKKLPQKNMYWMQYTKRIKDNSYCKNKEGEIPLTKQGKHKEEEHIFCDNIECLEKQLSQED